MADPQIYNYIIETGTVVADTGVILAQVEQEYRDAFGEDLVTDPSTPQGLLIQMEALARSAVAENNAALANQINPNLSGGIFLDAILALTGAQRNPAQFSTIANVALTGVAGTIIPAGSQASDSVNGTIFETTDEVTLSGMGTATVNFQAMVAGAINVAPNTLTTIVSDVLGWETVTNANAAVPGSLTQSDASAKTLRRKTLANQGNSLSEAITSAVLELPGVTSLSYRENISDMTVVIDGITMVPHSIFVCVEGGISTDIANILNTKKSAGAAYNGNTTVPITDPYSGQVIDVKFSRPEEVDFLVRATVKVDSSLQDPETAVRQAILAYQNGEIPNEAGLTVGTPVSCFELAGAVNHFAPGIFVQNMETSLAPPDPTVYSNDQIDIDIDQIARTNESSILVILA